MTDIVISGTCSACAEYSDGECRCANSPMKGQRLWSIACVGCAGYRRGAQPATPIDPRALAAVLSAARPEALTR